MDDMAYNILVVDDEPDVEPLIMQTFRRQIKMGQYRFIFAGDGEQGFQKVRENEDLNIIMTDINMPNMNGIEMLQKIDTHFNQKKNAQRKNVIIITAYGKVDNLENLSKNCDCSYLSKPIDLTKLKNVVSNLLNN